MEIRQLEAFVRVAILHNFTKAADELSLTQPAVTRQVGSLEQELGTKLLDRMGRRVELTSAGAALLPYAMDILRLSDESQKAVTDVASGVTGKLSVGASSTAATYLLPSLLRKFVEAFPQVQLSVSTGPSPRVGELVWSGAVDVGIVMDYQERGGLTATVLGEYAISVVAYPDHPLAERHTNSSDRSVAAEELAALPLIVMQNGATLRTYVEKLVLTAGHELQISMELDNVEAIKKMIEARLGISVLPDVAITTEIAAGRLIALPLRDIPSAHQRIAAIHRSDKYLSAAIKAFLALLRLNP